MTRKLTPSDLALWAALPMAHTSRIEGRLTMILDQTRPRRAPTRRVLTAVLGVGVAALVPLAMLRPAARAQAPGIRPGLAVTLAGITEAGSPHGLWWDQKGMPLRAPVYDIHNPKVLARIATDQPDPRLVRQGLKTVLFAFRLPPEARDVTVGYDFPKGSAFQMVMVPGPGDSFKERGGDERTEAQIHGETGGAHVLFATVPVSALKASLGIKTASGPWTTAAVERQPFRTPGFRPLKLGEKFVFWRVAWAKDEDLVNKGETLVKIGIASKSDTFSAAVNRDMRVVAVDKQGHELLPSMTSDIGIRGMRAGGVMARFPERPDQIAQFAVQTRPFQEVAFRDIALRPVR